jgi:L-fuconolactonase
MKIDAHQHFWKYDPVRDAWIASEMKTLRRDYLPHDLEPVLKGNGIDGCVVIQSELENNFQLENAEKYNFIKGVVGWMDLVEKRLQYYSPFKKLKGFRHVLQGEPQRDYMLKPEFIRGISFLGKYDFTYDILIYPGQVNFVKKWLLNSLSSGSLLIIWQSRISKIKTRASGQSK